MSIVDPIGLARVVEVGKILPWWWEWASLLFAHPHTNAVFYGHHPPRQGQGKTGSGVGNAQLSAVGIACSVGGGGHTNAWPGDRNLFIHPLQHGILPSGFPAEYIPSTMCRRTR